MKPFSLLLTVTLGVSAVGLAALPSQAHGLASGGVVAGLAHPLLGVDHLLMLLAVGTSAALLSPQLLLWALGGGVVGALWGGSSAGAPMVEAMAGVAIVAVAGLTLASRHGWGTNQASHLLLGLVVAGGLALHGHLHGLEASADGVGLLWWSGALLSSVALCGGTTLLLRALSPRWGRSVALAVLLGGAGWVLS
jgi:urease accessory protein